MSWILWLSRTRAVFRPTNPILPSARSQRVNPSRADVSRGVGQQ